MRLSIWLGPAVVATLGATSFFGACAELPECTRDAECGFDEICDREGACIARPKLEEQEEICTVADELDSILIDPTRGFAANDTLWRCSMPGARGGEGPRILSVDPPSGVTAVTGSNINLRFSWGGEPAPTAGVLIYGIENNGYFARNITEEGLPAVINANISLKAFGPGGPHTFFMAIDPQGTQDAPKPISIFRTAINVISVGSGDIQVNVQWDTDNDVDLHVISPLDEHVFFGNQQAESGGQLDLDSNVGCPTDGIRNENIFWPTGSAPEGTFQIWLDDFSAGTCAAITNYTVVVSRNFEVFQVVQGRFEPNDPDGDNDLLGELITTVDWPP